MKSVYPVLPIKPSRSNLDGFIEQPYTRKTPHRWSGVEFFWRIAL